MNERIKELAKQAGWSAFEVLEFGEQTERLAELIVRECAKISEEYADGSMPMCISHAIKNRFGVQ